MSNAIRLIFYYPYPDSPYDVAVTTDSYSELIGDLWDLVRTKEPGLVDHIGKARCTFFVVRLYFLYTIGGFFHIFFIRQTFFFSHLPPRFFAAGFCFGTTTIMATGPSPALGS